MKYFTVSSGGSKFMDPMRMFVKVGVVLRMYKNSLSGSIGIQRRLATLCSAAAGAVESDVEHSWTAARTVSSPQTFWKVPRLESWTLWLDGELFQHGCWKHVSLNFWALTSDEYIRWLHFKNVIQSVKQLLQVLRLREGTVFRACCESHWNVVTYLREATFWT